MNTISIIGNLTRDLELKYTTTGKAVANFTIAVPDRFNKENTYFIDCVVWNKLAELCAEYLSKGKKAGVVGRLTTRTYKNQDDRNVKVTEIVVDDVDFLTPKGESKTTHEPDPWDDLARKPKLEDIDITNHDDDEIPF